MINLGSTERAKRVARDLQAALADMGRPLGYSACLEMTARMLGHPSYGMLSRAAGRSAPTLDDREVPAGEALSRRAMQAAVLGQAGVPTHMHDAILARARPTARSRPRKPDARGGYGCAWFDADDLSGWACVAGGKPARFARATDLDPGMTWWSTLGYRERYDGVGYPPNVLFDKHFTISPLDALNEHGLDLSEPGAAQAAAGLGAQVLDRARGIVDAGVSGSRHRTLVKAVASAWKRGHGTDAMWEDARGRWEEFVATQVRRHRGASVETLRMPRLTYARSMMDTPVPTGAYAHVDLSGNPVRAMRLRYVRDEPGVAFVHAMPPDDRASGCPVREGLWHAAAESAWLPRPVFDALLPAMDLTPLAVMVAQSSGRPRDFLPDAAVRFLEVADPSSWADGIVAEAVWRSGLSNPFQGAGTWQASLAGAYLRGVDQANMCAEGVRLHGEGKAVLCFGPGWVRYTREG